MTRRPEDADFLAYRETGAPDALARVFDTLAPRLLLLAGHVTRDAALAEDLVQTTFLEAMRDARSYDGDRPVGAWLGGILRHRALDLRRRGDLREASELPADLAGVSDPAVLVGDREMFEEAVAAVEALPEPYREALLLRLVHGLTPTAIAHTLGRSPGTVRMQLKRGAERLRQTLPDRSELVGALLCVPLRGLSAVREAVLAEATRGAVVGAAGGSLGTFLQTLGMIGMSKTLLATLAVFVALLAWMFTAGPLGSREAPRMDLGLTSDTALSDMASVDPIVASSTSPTSSSERKQVTVDPAPTPAAEPGLRVRVRFDVDGGPAPDVSVYVRPLDGSLGWEQRTDANGVAYFGDVPREPVDVHLDRAPLRERVDLRSRNSIDLVIAGSFTLHGRVVDLDGAGVGGARVYRMNGGHHDVLHRVAICDPDGSFVIRGLADDVELIARASGYQPSEVEDADANDELLELQLGGRGYPLRGQVLDAEGNGVPNAWIAVGVDEDARDEWEGSTRAPEGGTGRKNMDREGILLRADDEGRFSSDEIPGGHLVIMARRFDGDGAQVGWSTLWLTSEGAEDVKLFMRPGAAVFGVLRDVDGRPVAGLELEAEWEGTPLLGQMEDDVGHYVSDRRVVSAVDGTFEIDGLLPGDYDLRVFGERQELLQDEFELAEGERRLWDPVIAQYQALVVTLLDVDGAPVEGWFIGVSPRVGAFPGWGSLVDGTDAQGRVRRVDLEVGVEHEVSVFADRTTPILPVARRRITIGGTEELEVRLEDDERRSASLTGQLVDGTGAAAGESRVVVELAGWDEKTYAIPVNGAFRVERLPPGEVVLRTTSGARIGTWTLSADEELDAGAIPLPEGE